MSIEAAAADALEKSFPVSRKIPRAVQYEILSLFDELGIVSQDEIKSDSRRAQLVYARATIAFLSYRFWQNSFKRLTSCLGKSFSTILYLRQRSFDLDYFILKSGINSQRNFRPEVVKIKLLSRIIVLSAVLGADSNSLQEILNTLKTLKAQTAYHCKGEKWAKAAKVEQDFLELLLQRKNKELLGKIIEISRRISLEHMMEVKRL